jgi:hypothetical protein
MKANRRSRETDKERIANVPHITISLDPREQSLLFCELEYNLSNALHWYITAQLNQGRLDADKLKKIADGWHQRGRPRVVGFRYDVETQLELVELHVDEFRFYGRRQANPIEIGGLLYAAKMNARAMRIRTFCQPDSVIARQLVDSQSLFNMLGVDEKAQLALAEIADFFKVIVEREKMYNRQAAAGREVSGPMMLLHGTRDGSHWEQSPPKTTEGRDPHTGHTLLSDGYDVEKERLIYQS